MPLPMQGKKLLSRGHFAVIRRSQQCVPNVLCPLSQFSVFGVGRNPLQLNVPYKVSESRPRRFRHEGIVPCDDALKLKSHLFDDQDVGEMIDAFRNKIYRRINLNYWKAGE